MTAMRDTGIDFARAGRPGAPIVLLLAGVVAATASVSWHASTSGEIRALEAQTAEMQRMLKRTPGRIAAVRGDAREVQQETRVANAVIEQLTVPWDLLFRDIEVSIDEDVALLAVQPDVANRTVRINGEARDLKAVLGYTRRLEASEMLGGVILHGHEVKTQDAQRPVQFVLTAEWGGRK